ncbi:MAG: Siroheme decarboxylase AhbA [Deltaproteobacteria bacterium]|nr:Siroheme decarboxylase AhbA [Deltaproteobacteria bacterium]
MGFNTEDIALIRELQRDIYLDSNPLQRVADSLGWSLDRVIDRVKELKAAGVIRRFGAALTPANAGFKTNAMIVWDMEGAEGFSIGEIMASHPRVSHCYIRPSFEGFQFTLYTMTHADSEEELQTIINDLSIKSGLKRYRILRTLKELKKTSPVYFG